MREQLSVRSQFEVFKVAMAIIRIALDLYQTRSLSFVDALIVQAASAAGCDILYSEDLNAGEIISGVKIVNPFVVPNA